MKKFFYLFIALAIWSCSSGGGVGGPSNKYIGKMAILDAKENEELDQCKGQEYVEVQKKYADLRQMEVDALEGTIMPCAAVSTGKGEGAVKVIGNNAVFKNGKYHVLLSFSKDYKVWALDYTNIDFGNSKEGLAYGTKAKADTRLNFEAGNVYLYSFDLQYIKPEISAELLTEKTDCAFINLNPNYFYDPVDKDKEISPERMATICFYSLHETVKKDDKDAFLSYDYAMSPKSNEFKDEQERAVFMEALDILSILCKDQTKIIKDYGKKLKDAGYTLESSYFENL